MRLLALYSCTVWLRFQELDRAGVLVHRLVLLLQHLRLAYAAPAQVNALNAVAAAPAQVNAAAADFPCVCGAVLRSQRSLTRHRNYNCPELD